jgi:uncharacterized membrane protein
MNFEIFVSQTVAIFFICSLINVMLSTMKTILTVKAGRHTASFINAVTYGFYTIVVKQLTSVDLTVAVVITIIANIVGVELSMILLDKFKKDKLWKISITTKNSALIDKLKFYDIQYFFNTVKYKNKEYYSIEVFSKNQKDSVIIKGILNEYNANYTITEIEKSF